ncbi:hypothetical protein CFOL_v3_18758 [Cephalotus follicularis]|uniref:Uncharacterized protein n=1 Tax=Cephalotus follicularis TaxID=3775 RepID=A0A1Q3C4V9_CEPFO|nr:hypothetical protein CFOL_v3_18758 [Cephalotus follicularis]
MGQSDAIRHGCYIASKPICAQRFIGWPRAQNGINQPSRKQTQNNCSSKTECQSCHGHNSSGCKCLCTHQCRRSYSSNKFSDPCTGEGCCSHNSIMGCCSNFVVRSIYVPHHHSCSEKEQSYPSSSKNLRYRV